MKKLNKLQINPEKLMKNEELVTLRGGWTGYCCVICEGADLCGPASGTSQESAMDILSALYSWCDGGPMVICGDQGY